MTLTEQLRKAARGYHSVYALARDSGICQPVLQRFVSGDRGMYLQTADRLAAFFGMHLTRPVRPKGGA